MDHSEELDMQESHQLWLIPLLPLAGRGYQRAAGPEAARSKAVQSAVAHPFSVAAVVLLGLPGDAYRVGAARRSRYLEHLRHLDLDPRNLTDSRSSSRWTA